MFALGLLSWMYHRPTEGTERFLREKFAKRPDLAEANVLAFRAGHAYGETTESFAVTYEVASGAAARGHVPADHRQHGAGVRDRRGRRRSPGCPCSSAPTRSPRPSDILHELSKHKAFGVTTFQAEDEIAGVGAALGAAFGGALGVTTTSGPGISLKSETIGLAVALELPLLVIDVQRGGPSTGLPTKTEQADLLQAMFGRNGEAPLPIIAPRSPADCFDAALEAVRIAVTYRTPVLLLSDGSIANGSEPWLVPDADGLPRTDPAFATEPNSPDGAEFWPYLRDDDTLARPWAVPGTPGLEHRIGGLEKADGRGAISYDPDNHDQMVRLRAAKIDGIAVPDVEVDDPSGRRRPARARLGLDVRADRRRRPARPQARAQDRDCAPASSQPAAGEPRRGPPALRTGARAGDEPGPARPAAARGVPRRRAELHQGRRPAVPRRGAAERLPGPPRPSTRMTGVNA